jgi:hypothetical protein
MIKTAPTSLGFASPLRITPHYRPDNRPGRKKRRLSQRCSYVKVGAELAWSGATPLCRASWASVLKRLIGPISAGCFAARDGAYPREGAQVVPERARTRSAMEVEINISVRTLTHRIHSRA